MINMRTKNSNLQSETKKEGRPTKNFAGIPGAD